MIYIIEENIDRMGGVERIVSILANYFINKNSVKVVSMYSNNNGSFFEYNKNVDKEYLYNKCNSRNKFINKTNYIFQLRKKIKDFCNSLKDSDIIIFGRVSVAIKFLPYIKINATIIVRDAINIHSHSKIVKIRMKKYFPTKVKTFIVSSNESLNEYRKFFGNKNLNMTKIYNPIGIKPKVQYNYKNKIITSVGRYDYQKGFENLIKAFKLVSNEYPEWNLKIIGDGPLRIEYENLIKKMQLSEKVELLHSSKNIENILCKSSIFVMTSRFEGYANALVEALACGIPSISYNWLTGVDEILNDNNGIIVELKDRTDYYKGIDNYEDVKKLSQAIIKLIDNPDVCNRKSEFARQIVESRNVDTILSKWERELNLID